MTSDLDVEAAGKTRGYHGGEQSCAAGLRRCVLVLVRSTVQLSRIDQSRMHLPQGANLSELWLFARLAVLPLSRLDASLVARRIRSGKLVRLPRASAPRTASMSSLGGRRASGLLSLMVGAVALGRLLAPPSPPSPRPCGGPWDESWPRSRTKSPFSRSNSYERSDRLEYEPFGLGTFNVSVRSLGTSPTMAFGMERPIVFSSLVDGRPSDAASEVLLGLWITRSDGFPRFPRLACLTRPSSPSSRWDVRASCQLRESSSINDP